MSAPCAQAKVLTLSADHRPVLLLQSVKPDKVFLHLLISVASPLRGGVLAIQRKKERLGLLDQFAPARLGKRETHGDKSDRCTGELLIART